MADWEPDRYRRFATERAQPFWDLLALVRPVPGGRAVDLGCGSGELTVAAARHLGVSEMLGVDRSPSMLAVAAVHDADGVAFVEGDIGCWSSDADVDVVLANASLQWVPDHAAVLARWTAALRPGGQLAVQVPSNADHDSHLVIAAVADREPFRSAFDGGPPPDPVAANVIAPEAYASVLHELGYERPHVRLQVYPHVLASTEDVVEWTRGTALNRITAALPDELHGDFLDAYRRELIARIGSRAPYLYAFKRILFVAERPR